MKRKILGGLISFVVICSLILAATPISASPGVPPDTPSPYTGMVSTSHPVASEVGAQVLREGGNAVDAAVAVQFALHVVEPSMSGIGGGGFMMIYLADKGETVVIDCREEAPAGATADMFEGMSFRDASRSGKAVGVPGTLDGLVTALSKYGTMSLAELIEPAIGLAEDGVIVNRPLASSIRSAMSKFNDAAKEVFAPGGIRLIEGDLLIQPDLAKTFRLIRDYGPEVFYGPHQLRVLANTSASEEALENILNIFGEPEIGRALVETVQAKDSTMTLKDLAGYKPVIREPVRGTYRGYEIASMSPPSSGGITLLQMLKILEGFDVTALGQNTGPIVYLMAETMHLAYADRGAYLADGDFVVTPYKGLLDDRYIAERRDLIDLEAANPDIEPGNPWQYEEKGRPTWWRKPGADWQPHYLRESAEGSSEESSGATTHFTVRDKWGNLVSYTTTIESGFGTGMMVPGYGFMLNNELTDFDFTPGGVNEVAPGKRPRSSMTPTIVFKDGQPVFTVGSPGGSRIITTVMQVIMNMIDHGMTVQDAIDAKRMHSASYPRVDLEAEFPDYYQVRDYLLARGHTVRTRSSIGSVQSIVICLETGQIYGGADSRREGTVIGVP